MPMHRGVVIRADHSGMFSGGKKVPAADYRAVFSDKIFRGSLESVKEQIDQALGSTPTARLPVPLAVPVPKKGAKKVTAAHQPAPKKSAKKSAKKAASKKAARTAQKKPSRRK